MRVYLVTGGLFTLAASLIWGVNTLFLLDAGLDIFQVMVANAIFSAGQVIFEVPTGVIADTIGRRVSFLFGIATLLVSTLLYLAASMYSWGLTGFAFASVLLGLGFTFQTGAVDAWVVDALDAVAYEPPRERVFARYGMVTGVAMLAGTLVGGFLGQIDLAIPYAVRAGVLFIALLVTFSWMHDLGFTRRPLALSTFGAETRTILIVGTRFGLRDPVIRPMLFVSGLQGLFLLYLFYSSQVYALDLIGRPGAVWIAGALTSWFGLVGVIGNSLVSRIQHTRWADKPWTVLGFGSALQAAFIVAMGVVGLLAPENGSIIAFVLGVAAFSMFGVVWGLLTPVRQAYINAHIPSEQRATVLSLDYLFADIGGAVGQPGLGWVAKAFSIPVGYLIGAGAYALSTPLYAGSGRAATLAETDPRERIE